MIRCEDCLKYRVTPEEPPSYACGGVPGDCECLFFEESGHTKEEYKEADKFWDGLGFDCPGYSGPEDEDRDLKRDRLAEGGV